MDPLADKILTSSAFISFASLGLVETWMVVTIVIRDILITLLRSYAELKNKPVITTKGAKGHNLIWDCAMASYLSEVTVKLCQFFIDFKIF